MEQEEIWKNHIKNTSIDDVIKDYNSPAIFQKELVQYIKNEIPDGRILEAGCELGVTSMLLADQFETTLLDLNSDAIELTKKAHELLDIKAEFVVGDMFKTPFNDKYFDVVFNAGVLEHFNKKERLLAIKEYSRIIKDNGVMILAYPNHYSLPYRLGYLVRRLINKWPYPKENKIYDMKYEINQANLVLKSRITISKKSLMRWVKFMPKIKKILCFIDRFFPFEGYLTVLKVAKK